MSIRDNAQGKDCHAFSVNSFLSLSLSHLRSLLQTESCASMPGHCISVSLHGGKNAVIVKATFTKGTSSGTVELADAPIVGGTHKSA